MYPMADEMCAYGSVNNGDIGAINDNNVPNINTTKTPKQISFGLRPSEVNNLYKEDNALWHFVLVLGKRFIDGTDWFSSRVNIMGGKSELSALYSQGKGRGKKNSAKL